jgi:hypothetical protein
MQITLQYFDGCPNWQVTQAHLEELQDEGVDLDVVHQLIDTPEAAEAAGFRGSPTVIVEGVDPFADPDAPFGLSCRVYPTETGFAGSPTLEQLRAAIVTSGT